MKDFETPFDGAVTRFLQEGAPEHIRKAVERAGGRKVLAPSYPYRKEMARKEYEAAFEALQIELARMQYWVQETGARVVVVFEGRDAAGKGGTIKRFTQNLNPRVARVVALPKPSDTERGQWYFQRYVEHLPSTGEIAFFDRSWYNRAVVEHVFGFCTPQERERFFIMVPEYERLLVTEGIHFFKIWLTVGRAEQLRRFLEREADPLKHWKLSRIDIEGLSRWEAYSEAIAEMFARTHLPHAPWTVIRADDKRRARLNAMRHVLGGLPYHGKDVAALGEIDPLICGGPEIMPDENV
ncbi:MAG: polyphosphate kinase 2 [Alphaproteobacteria bacterium]|nr:MAG: polyphosphate kinase 2 [Alphaproteobacteria bacterium]